MVLLVDYRAGNLTSVRLGLEAIGASVRVTSDPDAVRRAERIVFPGVGAARSAMDNLRSFRLVDAIREAVRGGIPFLGICLGMQILLETSEEDGATATLGLIPGRVRRFQPRNRFDKVPQIGWNQLRIEQPHPVLNDIPDESDFYFVHGFYPAPSEPGDRIGTTDYADVRFASVIGRGNMIATQFHPEKSGEAGLKLLYNFTRWDGGWKKKEGGATC